MEIERKYLLKQLPSNLDSYASKKSPRAICAPRLLSESDAQMTAIIWPTREPVLWCARSTIFLSQKAYDHLVQKIDGRLIEKTRYLIPLDGGLTAELDVFEGDLAPLTLVEVEFDSVDAANEFTAPDWFGEDVTESGKYHNSYLSRLENS